MNKVVRIHLSSEIDFSRVVCSNTDQSLCSRFCFFDHILFDVFKILLTRGFPVLYIDWKGLHYFSKL